MFDPFIIETGNRFFSVQFEVYSLLQVLVTMVLINENFHIQAVGSFHVEQGVGGTTEMSTVCVSADRIKMRIDLEFLGR